MVSKFFFNRKTLLLATFGLIAAINFSLVNRSKRIELRYEPFLIQEFAEANPVYISKINNSGTVVGYGLANQSSYVFHWKNGNTRILSSKNNEWFHSSSINNYNASIASLSIPSHTSTDKNKSVYFSPDGKEQEILPNTSRSCTVSDINDSGNVVGSDEEGIGFIWKDGNFQSLGYLEPTAINAHNIVAATFYDKYEDIALVWDSGEAIPLPTTGIRSVALDINESGEVVGYVDGKAIKWQLSFWGKYQQKILDRTDSRISRANGINKQGQIVGTVQERSGHSYGFLWHRGNFVDLNSLIPTDSGCELMAAIDINDKGEIIGVGTYDGKRANFLLKPVQ
jgi:probable HAF family extracellular repeat protein